ncbi:uncharacterized protein LOC115634369 [Scaptodrosophila lebanonensis]|uniref:Uncharacterized protein LOC115634369 n=1 Tax=Drosophila lebanonensis TaxID=7225 RepID=A0A6J2UK83_DROLE|nr:uncharacterized protein LOC115634369 [Scaptodrosophila lebanonensis]
MCLAMSMATETDYDRPYTTPRQPYPNWLNCGQNGTISFCSSRCEETCKYKSRGCPPRICGGPCVCKQGYIIDEDLPGCVLRADCRVQQLEVPSHEVTSLEQYGANYGNSSLLERKFVSFQKPKKHRITIRPKKLPNFAGKQRNGKRVLAQ